MAFRAELKPNRTVQLRFWETTTGDVTQRRSDRRGRHTTVSPVKTKLRHKITIEASSEETLIACTTPVLVSHDASVRSRQPPGVCGGRSGVGPLGGKRVQVLKPLLCRFSGAHVQEPHRRAAEAVSTAAVLRSKTPTVVSVTPPPKKKTKQKHNCRDSSGQFMSVYGRKQTQTILAKLQPADRLNIWTLYC